MRIGYEVEIQGTGITMKLDLKRAFEATQSLFRGMTDRLAHGVRALLPRRKRVIELTFHRRNDAGTRRSAAIHIDARGRRQRP